MDKETQSKGAEMENPFKVTQTSETQLTGHSFSVVDSRTDEQIGSNLSRSAASEVAREEWAIEQGEE